VLGVQVLNPIHNESTEHILIYDSPSVSLQARIWDLRRDLMVFPTLSKMQSIRLKYESGANAIGNVILVITCTTGKRLDGVSNLDNLWLVLSIAYLL